MGTNKVVIKDGEKGMEYRFHGLEISGNFNLRSSLTIVRDPGTDKEKEFPAQIVNASANVYNQIEKDADYVEAANSKPFMEALIRFLQDEAVKPYLLGGLLPTEPVVEV